MSSLTQNPLDQGRSVASTTLSFAPITGNIGAEVSGIDLAAPQSDETIKELDRAVANYGVLIFRDQSLTPEQHRAFGARFGDLHIHPYERNLGPEHPEVIVLDSELYRAKGKSSVPWHADATFEERPPRGSILRAVQLPEVGGDTLWSSMYAAWDALSSPMQRLLDGLHAEHDSTKSFGQRVKEGRAAADAKKEMSATTHPVVITHPVSGRRALFVNAVFTTRIVELSPAESDRVLAQLFEHTKAPEFQVRLRWAPGTVAFWDNRATQHYAVGDYVGRRLMQRVTVLGDRPAA